MISCKFTHHYHYYHFNCYQNCIIDWINYKKNIFSYLLKKLGEIITREPLDRELRSSYDLVAEARDQGTPYRSARVSVRVHVTDVNDNPPEIVDPQEDVVSVREEQPPGTEVVRIRAIDRDNGYNASISYSILKGRDSDGYGIFSIDPISGVIRTRMSLDHEERSIYRLAVAATDSGKPPKQTVRLLRVEVLDLNDNRPTFTSSSLVFRVSIKNFSNHNKSNLIHINYRFVKMFLLVMLLAQ